jgi:putative inorganic carbon (HCO3(-)) transporter
MENIKNKISFRRVLVYLLSLLTITPLIYTQNTIYPFIFGKMVFLRALIILGLGVFLIGVLFKKIKISKDKVFRIIKNPVSITLLLFFISLILSTIFSVNISNSFWGNAERAEGLFTLICSGLFWFLSLLIFKKEDWFLFFKSTIIVGLITIIYAIFQFIGFDDFPFALKPKNRPGSFIGNPAIFSVYVLYVLLSSFIISLYSKKGWFVTSVFGIIFSVVGIFIAQTRALFVGLFVGLLISLIILLISKKTKEFKIKNISFKKISGIILSLLILFVVFFGLTKSASFWQKIPGFNRLAETSLQNKDNSTGVRMMTWNVSWESFKEKPVLGWGLENYVIAYSKNYNPDYALYGETWLDRAHNKFFDILVMQGLVGLVFYLSLIISFIYILFKKDSYIKEFSRNDKKGFLLRMFIFGVFISYLVQNMFLFDDIVSYIYLFSFLSFVVFITTIKDDEYKENDLKINIKNSVLSILIIFLSLFSMYKINFLPLSQSIKAVKAKNTSITAKDIVIEKIDKATKPYNFVQPSIRAYLIGYYNENKAEYYRKADYEDFTNKIVSLLDEVVEKSEKVDPRFYIRKLQILNEKGKEDQKFFEDAEKVAKKAISLMPKRQEVYYAYAFSLVGQQKNEEAIKVAKKAIDLSPKVARAYYHLGFIYAVSGNKEKALENFDKSIELSKGLKKLVISDLLNMVKILQSYGRTDKISEIVHLLSIGDFNSQIFDIKYYNISLFQYLDSKDSEKFISICKYLKKLHPELVDNMDTLIDLASKNRWEIIESFIQIR